ncbi:MAG: hypothetical protein IT350_05720 [Deltaproteobacteria bacterium]|nr:hypothetical protein [Deltaproteobacteria bacterium]
MLRMFALVALLAALFAGCYARDGGRDDADVGAPLLDKSNDAGKTAAPFDYSEDFNSDPDWSVSDTERYFWDASCECFFLTMEGGEVTRDYAYVDLAAMGFEFGPIRLTYDIRVDDLNHGANLGLMWLTPDLDVDRAVIRAQYSLTDGGRALYLGVFPFVFETYFGDDAWETGIWMTHEIVWDGRDVTLTERRSGIVSRVLAIEDAEVWTEDPVPFLGFSSVGFDIYDGAAAHGWIDNIRITTID